MKRPSTLWSLAILLAIGAGQATGQFVWTQDARNPILSGGAPGTWNQNVMVPCVLFNTDSSRYEMWFTGSDGTWDIGYATSKDGINWTMHATPVLSSTPGTWDENYVQAPAVIRENGQYKMWYSSYRNIPPVYPYSIGYATSPDGIHWTKYSGNPVLGPGTAAWEAGGPYSCAVIPFPGGYKMWYAGSDSTESCHSMGYATSVDGITWQRDTVHNPVLDHGATGEWDSPYVGLPNVLHIGNSYYMWYVGNKRGVGESRSIGVATSTDSGLTWTKYPNNPVLSPSPRTWSSWLVMIGTVLSRGDTLDMWFDGWDNNYVGRIGHATSLLTVAVAPFSCDFHNVRPGSVSDTLSITVINGGQGPRQILSLSLGKTEFVLSPMPFLPLTVSSLGQIQLKLTFNPRLPGVTVQDTLIIITSDPYLPRSTVILSGRGSGAVQPVRGGVLYGVAASAGTVHLYEINRLTGSASLDMEFSPQPPTGLSTFTVRRADNTMYAAFSTPSGTDIFRLSSQYGDLEHFSHLPVGEVTAMAFSASDALYLVSGRGKMYRVQGGISDTVFVGWTGYPFTGLSFSPATGVLWGSLQDTVFTLDTLSGTATVVGANGLAGPHSSIAFNNLGTLYGLFAGELVTVDRVWGRASEIGYTGIMGLTGIAMSDVVTGVDEETGGPVVSWQLAQNYPNPFNSSTTIRYGVPHKSYVSLAVFNTLGQQVALLVQGEQEAGYHEARFAASGLASGMYFYRLMARGFVQTRKLLLIN